MESSEFISVDQILSDLVTLANDEDYTRSGLDKGFYISRIHDAVTHFALETFYQIVTKDIINYDTHKDGIIDIPVNCFNIKEIYLFNGSAKCKEHQAGCTCSSKSPLEDYVNVHWKRTLNVGSSKIKMSRIKADNRDPVLSGSDVYSGAPNKDFISTTNIYYANLQGGKIILSDSCSNYSNIRIVYNGMGSENGTIPCIPRIIKDGIFDKAALDCFYYLKVRDKSYRTDYVDAYNRFNGSGRVKGSLRECKNRILSMDSFKRNDMMEYLANADFL